MGGRQKAKSHIELKKCGDCIQLNGFWFFEISCTITKNFSEEKPIWPI
jgi:hypothetical protein